MAAPGDPDRLRHVVRRQPAREHEGEPALDAVQHAPVEGRAVAAGPRAVLGRARIEQDEIGGVAIVERRLCILRGRHLDGFHHRLAPAPAHLGARAPASPRRAAAACRGRPPRSTVSISASSGSTSSATILARPRALAASALAAAGDDVARARREEHQAHVVGAARQRRVQRRLGLEAADLHLGGRGHGGSIGQEGNREWGIGERGEGVGVSPRRHPFPNSPLPIPYSPQSSMMPAPRKPPSTATISPVM